MTTLVAAVFSASLLGSLHCAGMCGPFCGIAVSGGRSRREAGLLHVAYHGGRLVTYSLLGAVAGTLGAIVDIASTLAGWQPVALALAGGAMMLVGIAEIARLRGWSTALARWNHWRLPRPWVQFLQRGQRFAAKQAAVPRALTIGLLTTLLPCGWLYAFLLTAAGTGGPLTGTLVMATFWIGTLPVLLSLGLGVRKLSGALGERLPLLTAAVLVAVGFVTLCSRTSLSPQALAATVTQEATAQSASTPDPLALPPCCHERLVQP